MFKDERELHNKLYSVSRGEPGLLGKPGKLGKLGKLGRLGVSCGEMLVCRGEEVPPLAEPIGTIRFSDAAVVANGSVGCRG